jgi:hypothetical protein
MFAEIARRKIVEFGPDRVSKYLQFGDGVNLTSGLVCD